MFRKDHIQNIENHKYNVIDLSISTSLCKPFWNFIERYVPFWIAPNIITLLGLFSTFAGTYFTFKYYDNYPFITTFFSIFFTVLYVNLDAIDGIHARNTKNTSAIGELLDHGCDSISTSLLAMMFCKLLNINNLILMWKFTMLGSLGFLLYHFNSYKTSLTFGKYTGPVELLSYFLILCFLNLVFPQLINKLTYPFINTSELMLFFLCIYTFYFSFDKEITKKFTVMTWLIKSLTIFVGVKFFLISDSITLAQIFFDSCAISFVTWEILLNSMAKKDSGIVVFPILFSHYFSGYIGMIFSTLLIFLYINEIAQKLQMNILTQNINVYFCGTFDLCHYGHKRMFEKSLEYGTRLIVGVHNDTTVVPKKLIMNMNERIREVETSKYVWKVFPNASLEITDKELDDLNIHVVTCYYNCSDDTNTSYVVPKKRGILKLISHSHEISTVELINRCKTL